MKRVYWRPNRISKSVLLMVGLVAVTGTLAIEYFPVHHIINGASKCGLENVANLDTLPPRDFTLIVAPIKVENGTGGPTRIFAIVRNE